MARPWPPKVCTIGASSPKPANGLLRARLCPVGGVALAYSGFRSMFSTYWNARCENPDLIERCLAHVPGDKVRAAYNCHQYRDERRRLMQQWADHIAALRQGWGQQQTA